MRTKFLRLFQPSNPDKPLGGRYKVVSQLGAGGFGQTFLAEDLHLPGFPRCVVKQLKPQVSDAESLQTARRLFDTEARVLYQLGNHDQIPRLLAHFEDNREFYLAQELIEGESLTQELVLGQHWSESQVISLLQDLLNVLSFVHQQQVIHRDIKPSNLIRRRQDGKIVLIDFGAVKQVSTQLLNPKTGETNLTISIGTQGYMPKEQLGGNPRFSSDIYAVGIIGIQALTGVHPRFLKENPQTGEIDWHEQAKQVSPELAAFLDQMVRYDFRVRYSTATEALAALRGLSILSLPQPRLESPASLPRQELPLSSPTAETKKIDSASDIPPTQPQQVANGTGQIEAVGHRSPQLSASSAPTVISPDSTPGQLRKTWPILAILAAVGASFLVGKTLLSTQTGSQTADKDSGPVQSSAVQPMIIPTEEPRSQASASPTVASPSPTPTAENSASPAPTSPTVTSPSPTPIAENRAFSAPASSAVESSPANSGAKQPTAPVPAATPVTQASPTSPTPASPVPAQPATKLAEARSESRVPELLSRANNLRQAQKYQQALKVYDKVIASKADVAEAHWGRCYTLNSLQRVEEALAACDQALAVNPNYPEALWSKGSALEQQQRYSEALKLYERATELKPNFAEAWNNRGTVLYHLKRSAEAVAAYQEAIDHKPDFSDAWANRGAALWDLKRFDEARASVNKALEIQPDNQNALNLRQQMQ